jgi:hypothetical protein
MQTKQKTFSFETKPKKVSHKDPQPLPKLKISVKWVNWHAPSYSPDMIDFKMNLQIDHPVQQNKGKYL